MNIETAVYDIREAAKVLGCSERHVRENIRKGNPWKLPIVRIGRKQVVPKKALYQWLEQRAEQ